MRLLFVYASVCLCLLPCFSDVIITDRNKIAPVVITQETFEQIYYQFIVNNTVTPGEQKIETRRVVKLEYDKIPIDFQTAEGLMEIRSYAKAIDAYRRFASRDKGIFRQHALYKIGLCYRYANKHSEAIKAFQTLLKTYSETFYKAEVNWELGHAHLNLRKWADAIKFFDEAKQLYQKKDALHPRNQESQYYQALALEKSGKHQDAIPLYNSLLLKIGQNKELGNKIQLSLIACYEKTKQIKHAQQTLSNLLKEIEPDQKEILANIYQYYGKMYFDENKMEEALLCYLRIIMMYPEVPEITKDAYNKAIYCMDLLKKEHPEYTSRIAQIKQMQARIK